MSSFAHIPVLYNEVLESLRPKEGGRYVDGTVGGGGHAAGMLEGSSPDGWLWGCDQDEAALQAASERLAGFAGRFELRLGNFAGLSEWVPAASCDGVLYDLGVSSPQLDTAERGFSFQQDGPLDMRMNRRHGRTAAELVNMATVEELARIFWEYGGERDSRRLARAIAQDRQHARFTTTGQLASLIERLSPRRGRKAHPATKIFQALRIAVNDELNSLRRGLDVALGLLKPGGRLAVITFHSVEDHLVKEFGRTRARDYTWEGEVDVPELRKPKAPELRLVTRKAILPGETELAENPRSRSAQLRVMEKV